MENGQLYDSLLFVVHEWTLQKTPLTNFQYNNQIQKDYRNGGKALIGSKWDNKTNQVLQILSGGSMFSFSVTIMHFKGQSRNWELSFWDVTGSVSLHNTSFPVVDEDTDVIPKEKFDTIIEILKDYSKGFIRCSKCKTRIPVSEIAGSYFAGRYCDECWNKRGMKEIEAKETYD